MPGIGDLKAFKGVLPYASELFGVYQPLLGWKSTRTESRYLAGLLSDRIGLYAKALTHFNATVAITPIGTHNIQVGPLKPAEEIAKPKTQFGSMVLQLVSQTLPPTYTDQIWNQVTPALVQGFLDGPVKQSAMDYYAALVTALSVPPSPGLEPTRTIALGAVTSFLNYEQRVAGLLLDLKSRGAFSDLRRLAFDAKIGLTLSNLLGDGTSDNPLDSIDPHKDLDRVGLSPIGIVHLFRQFFFEFDTFLGSPVGHVWLSPGGTVELVEVSTRKTTIEQTIEASTEITRKSDTTKTTQDDLADAVKQDNQQNTKFGATANSNQNWVWGSANESGSFDLGTTQQTARETAHKQMRQQAETLSEQIKTSYKTTFRTVSEVTDMSSKRYVLANTTENLINYEMRRKMRQVGVQMQDVGTYLCWQTYVDDVNQDLGVADLIHIVKPQNLPADPNPQSVPQPAARLKGDAVTHNYQWPYEDDPSPKFVEVATLKLIPPLPGYLFDSAQVGISSGNRSWHCSYEKEGFGDPNPTPEGEENVTSVKIGIDGPFNDEYTPLVTLEFTPFYKPSKALIASVAKANKDKVTAATNEQVRAYKQAYIDAASNRVNLASKIVPRPYDELREEERIVVYRKLITQMLTKGINIPDPRTRHIVAELLNSIFDIDKMLYFVAPEWWRPHSLTSKLSLGSLVPAKNPDGSQQIGDDGKPIFVPDSNTAITDEAVVSWGGAEQSRKHNNYYITGDSTPARLGSSLGWLLQLDGDNMRNAFLNAPWVKAVMPIRPGKERAALNWLQQVEGKGGIGVDDFYAGTEPALVGKTMIQVLQILADSVAAKHQESITVSTIQDPSPSAPGDPASTVTSTPVDRVYEHGFWPLQGGFRAVSVDADGQPVNFVICDQWIEVLPTDQVVPVEVSYDPKTGRQL